MYSVYSVHEAELLFCFLQEEMTSLHFAAERKEAFDILPVLVSVSCNVNSRNKVGRTALHLAAKRGNLGHLQILLDSGCDRALKDKFGVTALGVAMKFGQSECVDFLLHYQPREKNKVLEKDVTNSLDAHFEDISAEGFKTGQVEESSFSCRPENCNPEIRKRNNTNLEGQLRSSNRHSNRHSASCGQNGAAEVVEKMKRVVAKPERSGAKEDISQGLLHLVQALVSWKLDTLDNTLNHGRICVACKVSPNTYFLESKLLDGVLELLSTRAPFTTAPSYRNLYLGPVQTPARELKDSRSTLSSLCLKDLQQCSGRDDRLVLLLSGLQKSLSSHSTPSRLPHLSANKPRRSFSLPADWKSQRDASLYDVDRFAQVFLKLCAHAPSRPKAVERILDSMFVTVFAKKIFELDVLAKALLKHSGLARAEPAEVQKPYGYQSSEKDHLTSVFLNLEYVINRDFTPTLFAEAVFEELLNQVEILNFVLHKCVAFLSSLTTKILKNGNKHWNTDKASKIFLQACDKLKLDQRLLVKVAGAFMSQALTQPCCDAMSLVTCILIRMGLLKGEDHVDVLRDLEAPLIALEHVFKQDYFPRTLAAVFASFLAKSNPLLYKFQEWRLRALKSAMIKEVSPETAAEACEAFGKGFKRVCDTLTPEGLWETAEECCDELALKAWVELSCQLWPAGESLLISLGLMKSETRTEPVRSTQNALKLLRHIVSQSYFPRLLVPMFQLFLQKPNARLESCQKRVDDVLKCLQEK